MDPRACFDVASLNGGKGIRTPDIQLAKLALYQLSYAPALLNAECRLRNAECKSGEHSAAASWSGQPALLPIK